MTLPFTTEEIAEPTLHTQPSAYAGYGIRTSTSGKAQVGHRGQSH
jgi:hypothetical protein